jgi:hypothetical protein
MFRDLAGVKNNNLLETVNRFPDIMCGKILVRQVTVSALGPAVGA